MSNDNRGKPFASKFYAHRLLVQAIPSGVRTLVQLNTINYDILDEFDEAVLYRFVPLQAGYYDLHGQMEFPFLPIGTISYLFLEITGADYSFDWRTHNGAANLQQEVSHQIYLTPADWVNIDVWQNSGIPQNLTGGINVTLLSGFRFG